MTVYEEMGISHYGILLSEKDSIVYPNALSPELRKLTDTSRVHRVPDYTGASKEERVERIGQIIQIAKDNGYDAVFAGYGFMAEDDEFVAAIEEAGLKFIGPCSATQRGAGKKDEAKRTALSVDVSVTPGIDNVTARTLVKKHPSREALLALVKAEGLKVAKKILDDKKLCPGTSWPTRSSSPPTRRGSTSSPWRSSAPRSRPNAPKCSGTIPAPASVSRRSAAAAARGSAFSAPRC